MHILKETIPGCLSISPEVVLNGIPVTQAASFDQGWFQFKGVGEGYGNIKGVEIKAGRFFNQRDVLEASQVIVIGDRVVQKYFKNHDPIGEDLFVKGLCFTIVGVLDDKSFLTMAEQNNILFPITSLDQFIQPSNHYPSFGILMQSKFMENGLERLKKYLGEKYHFEKNDPKALYIINYKEQLSSFSKFFKGFDIFLLFVGCCLLLSGIIGISNIMYIAVKERTCEIGIRKAIGADSVRILKEFILEAFILTLFAGIIGIVAGYGALTLLDFILSNFLDETGIIEKTSLKPGYIVLALLILCISGLLAGIFPAKKAADVLPVEAMKTL
jgi:putative ABC transport system permease protein